MVWIFAAAVLVLAVSYGCYWIAFYNPERRHGESVYTRKGEEARLEALYQEMESVPYETVTIRSFDGLQLRGRYYHISDDAPVLIQFHGYRGSGIRDCGTVNSILRKAGVNTLLVDQRAHGMSQGNTMTFGILERYDVQSWCGYICRRFGADRPVFLFGVSMGAATVVMASELDLPGGVAGIIADCPYSGPGAIIRKVCRDMKLPAFPVYPFVVLGALIFGRFRIWESSPVQAAGNTDIPILLIHGSEDKYVPSAMSGRIFDACRGKRYLEIFPGAAHAGSCLTDAVRYEKILRSFMAECLPEETESDGIKKVNDNIAQKNQEPHGENTDSSSKCINDIDFPGRN